MAVELKPTEALELWRGALVESVRRAGPDLSARQMAVVLTVYMTAPPHTVRGLAKLLNVSKPAITRALDRLSALGYLRRKPDDADRRSILVQRTVKGSVFLREFAEIIVALALKLRDPAASPASAAPSAER
ncbi:MAG: MarR family transcriptional regulator [Alphaproteobacteria bacterium]|nr:MarR family transcriptional regulator [Alphaproteobacteria bacterium]